MASVYWSTYPTMKVIKSDNTWHSWSATNTSTITATTPITFQTETVWGIWNEKLKGYKYVINDYRTTNTSATDEWETWNRQDYRVNWQYGPGALPAPRVTPIDRVAVQAARAKQIEDVKVAKARAEMLLLEHLDDEQKHEFHTYKRFHVRSQHGRRYRIMCERGHHNNVYEVDNTGKAIKELCAAPRGDCPTEDKFLGQKLALEFAEDAFLASANIWDLQGNRELCNAVA